MRKKYILLLGLLLLGMMPPGYAQNHKWYTYWQKLNQMPVDSVTELRLEGMALEQLPLELLRFRSVRFVNLDNNLFTMLPEALERFPHLEKLSVRRNKLAGKMVNLRSLKELSLFDAGENKLDKHLQIHTNDRLKKLVLDGMGILQLKIKGKLPTEVDLSGSQLQKLKWMPWRKARVEVLVLHSNRLSSLPKGVAKLKRLRKLVLGNNGFETIPKEMARFKKLESLMFYKNRLTSLPDFVWQMQSLTEIDVHHNRLDELPEGIGNLPHLTELYLANNCLRSLPDNLGNLKALRFLYVENNELESLPASFSGMQSLERLSLLGNRFLVYPAVLNQMTWLHELDISENDIEAFPTNFDRWKSLKLLLLHDNACKNGMACMLELLQLEQKLSKEELRMMY